MSWALAKHNSQKYIFAQLNHANNTFLAGQRITKVKNNHIIKETIIIEKLV